MTTKDSIKFFGTGIELAKQLNIKPEAVYQWGDEPPMLRQFQIEQLTNGELKRAA